MSSFLKTFGTAAVVFGILDFVWLGYLAKPFNMRQLSQIGRFKEGQFDLLAWPAVIVYILMSLAVALFVMPRIQTQDPAWLVVLTGSVMGLIVYGVGHVCIWSRHARSKMDTRHLSCPTYSVSGLGIEA